MPTPTEDIRVTLSEAIRQIREARHALHESVVEAVKQRSRLMEELVRREREASDLDAKAALADQINNAALAKELRDERARRDAGLAVLRGAVVTAEARAESAKMRLPEEEHRLLQQANDLQAQFARLAGARASGETAAANATEEMWNRASNKIHEMGREASAREEVSAAIVGPAGAAAAPPAETDGVLGDADRMLADLEQRMGLAGPAAPAPRFLELDDRPGPASSLQIQNPQTPRSTPPAGARTATAGQGEHSIMHPNQRVRIAAIGTGSIFRGAHLPAYPDIAQAQLVAICDPDKTAQQLAYARFKELVEAKSKAARERNDTPTAERLERDLAEIQIVEDIRQVIDTIKPDLVDICTQPVLHAPLSIQALEAGLHVMCEKPISRSWLESQRLIEAVKRTGKFYQHNENWLWEPDYYTAKKLVDAGAIGEPILMFLATAHGGPEGRKEFWDSDFGGGGALLDNGIHAIGASWFISGLDKRPTYVKAAEPFGMSIRMQNRILDGRYQKVRVDDDAHILIRFENPETLAWTTAHVEGSWSHRDSPDTAVIGTTGRIVFLSEENRRYAVVMDAYDREARRIEVSGPTWQYWPSSFYGEILNMVESVRNNVPSISDAAFGAECSAIVGASYLSERDGRRAVPVEEFKAFARSIADRYPNDLAGADNALVDALLTAVRR